MVPSVPSRALTSNSSCTCTMRPARPLPTIMTKFMNRSRLGVLPSVPRAFSVSRRGSICRRVHAGATDQKQTPVAPNPTTAKDAVESGLEAFSQGSFDRALELFQLGLSLGPDENEACAALYNSACCYVKQKRWQEATDAVVKAVNDYNLKLDVAVQDPDLRQLRERREWIDALDTVRGGISNKQLVQLRGEAKSPFRLVRLIFFGGLEVGAVVGLFIIIARLTAALKGGEGAPEVAESLQNLGINGAAVAVLGWLLARDLKGREQDEIVVAREESLARLQISLGPDRILPIAAFRGSTRPVILAGSKAQVARAMKEAAPYITELRERGVSVIPVNTNTNDPSDRLRALKEEFKSGDGGAAKKGFGKAAAKPEASAAASAAAKAPGKVAAADSKWELTAYAVEEWLAWLEQQKAVAGVKGDNVYVQIQLDGTVRASGTGTPPWQKFLDDIPPLDDVRTKFTDGIGRT